MCALVCNNGGRDQIASRKITTSNSREPTRTSIEQRLEHALGVRYRFAVLLWLVVCVECVALGRVNDHDVRVLVDLREQHWLLSDWRKKQSKPRGLTIPCCVNGHHMLLCVLAGMLFNSSILAWCFCSSFATTSTMLSPFPTLPSSI